MTTSDKVWGEYPSYFKQPFKWVRYHAHTKPHFVASIALGLSAPFLVLLATPLRRKFLYADHEPIPKVYPLPTRARDANLSGFDDE